MKSKIISLSAISAGLIAISLTIGAYFEIADIFSVVIASVFVLLPLYYKSYKGAFLAFLVGGIVAMIISGFNIYSLVFLVYFTFFGIYPIIRNLLVKINIKKYLIIIIGAVWFVVISYGAYYYYSLLIGDLLTGLPKWFVDNALYFLFVIALVFYFVFDRFIVLVQRVLNYYLYKFIK